MRNFTQVLILCTMAIVGYGQQNFNLDLVSNLEHGEPGNDIWGYVDSTGTEYAVMGTRENTIIWSLEDPANPIERASIPGPAGVWRDIKSFEDHLYVTSDQGTAGLLIIDMSMAPDSISYHYWTPEITIDDVVEPLNKCHNLYIDTDQGYCYLSGCNVGNGGILILDLNEDKKTPVHVGSADLNYSHDVYVKNDRLYTSEIYLGMFNVYDITDKTNPILLNGDNTSSNFTHNAWLSDDGKYLFTTDERANAWVDAFDISDLDDIQFLDRYQPLATQNTGVIPHNTHYKDGFIITSWYTDGIVVCDVNKPDNIIKVASYDTETVFTEGFEGTWGAYPYLPSGLVLGSDLNNGLFILQPTDNAGIKGYQRASYLEGNITDVNTGATVPNTIVKIISEDDNYAISGITGDYKTGQATSGDFMVEVSHANYDSQILPATLVSGEVTVLDVQLGNAIIKGSVIDEDGNGVANAQVAIESEAEGVRIVVEANEDGEWETGVRSNLDYNIYAGSWGYLNAGIEVPNFQPMGADLNITLVPGYQDDFFADLGWTSILNATSGEWALGRPNSIFAGNGTTQTANDISTDLGTTYYVTGISGTSGGADDIDNGSTVLTSPTMDLLGNNMLDLSYYVWFANAGGNSTPNDRMTVSLTNGSETILLTEINTNSSEWSDKIEVSVSADSITFTDQMQVIVFATDDDPGHIVEVGFDAFSAQGYTVLGTGDLETDNIGMTVYPNPADQYINLNINKIWDGEKNLMVTDNTGKVIMTKLVQSAESMFNVDQLPTGIYNIQIIGESKKSETVRLVKK